ncbi:MAG: alpha/beta hydrolase [Proteobacteria bacterium]|nr:alpha/beta hydrolase [Pseudomonadota bacterium]
MLHRRLGNKFIITLAAVPALGYCAAFSYLLFAQRSFIFLPAPPGVHTPAEYAVPFEAVRIAVGDKGSLAAWWVHHESTDQRPTVVYCHGNGGTLSMYANVARIFYNLGWNALIFDYRGYGASSPVDVLSEASVGEDAYQAYRWALTKVPERQLIIWGHSLGGAIAAKLAERTSPSGLVLEGTFPSLLRIAQHRYPLFPVRGFMLQDTFDTRSYLEGRRFPVLIMHAEHDEIIPFAIGRELYEEASQPKEFLSILGAGHNDFPAVHALYDRKIRNIIGSWTASGGEGDGPAKD